MSAAATTALPLPKKPKRTKARNLLETGSYMSGVNGLSDAGTHLGKMTTAVERGINTGATKLAGVAAKRGWYKLAGWFLKIAAAAPLAAKIVVGIAVVAVAAIIYQVVRAA
jgi:ectoine hydroxylase-related dioxygenase (phytanoyl-CoA dioxygenase family)